MAAVTLNVNGYMWPEYKHLLKCLADFLDNIKQVHIQPRDYLRADLSENTLENIKAQRYTLREKKAGSSGAVNH